MPCFDEYLIDIYEELHSDNNVNVLFEGAQGFGLDIDWGDYPYVTSSHCTSASALLNGVPPQAVNRVWGVAKAYETYVGNKKFEPKDDIFSMIRKIGLEYGATTGRPRQCNWLNWDFLEKAAKINGVTDVVFNKMDVLHNVNRWVLLDEGKKVKFDNEDGMKSWIKKKFSSFSTPPKLYFSGNPSKI